MAIAGRNRHRIVTLQLNRALSRILKEVERKVRESVVSGGGIIGANRLVVKSLSTMRDAIVEAVLGSLPANEPQT
jgi:hypothetical protein